MQHTGLWYEVIVTLYTFMFVLLFIANVIKNYKIIHKISRLPFFKLNIRCILFSTSNLKKKTLTKQSNSVFWVKLLTKNSEVHNYQTRNSLGYSAHKGCKMFSDRPIRAAGPTFWNSLDYKLKQGVSSKHFRNMYKSNLIAC